MASPVAPFPCPKCGYTVVYHRNEYFEMGIEYMTRWLKCLSHSCNYKDNVTTIATVPDADALFPLGRLYMRQADVERVERAIEDGIRSATLGSLERQNRRLANKVRQQDALIDSLTTKTKLRPQVQL